LDDGVTALLAGIHWWGYLSGGYFGAALVNTIPFATFAVTLPAARATTAGTSD
jgi:hypothetical protein